MYRPKWRDWQGLDCEVTKNPSFQTVLMGQIMFFGAKPNGKKATAVQRDSKEFSWLSFWQETPLWGAGFSCFKEQHCPLPAPSCLGLMRKSLELIPCGAGRRLLLSLPAPWYLPCISAAFMEEQHCRLFFDSFLSKEMQEKKFFSTSNTDRTIRNLSKGIGRSAHQHTPSEKTALFPPPHADTTPQGCCWHWVSLLTLEDWCSGSFFAPWWAYLQCISASQPKAGGDGFGIAKLSYFSRDRPASALTLRTDTRFGAGPELIPARWVQNQEPSPSIKVQSKALQLMHLHGHSEQRIMSTSVQSSLRCFPEDIGKSLCAVQVRGGQRRDERKAPDLSGERHMPLPNK